MDLSLDAIIAKEGICVRKTSDKKSNGLEEVVIKVNNDMFGANKRKNPFEDNASKDGGNRSVANTNGTNRGNHFGPNSGQIFVDNLKYEVNDEDVEQLFSAFGPLKRSAINYQSDGRPAGTAFVVFERKADALTAAKSLDNITLDGL